MKKILALLFALLMVFSMVACGNKEQTPPADDSPKAETPAVTEDSTAKPYEGITLTYSNYIRVDEATDTAFYNDLFDAFEEETGATVEVMLYDAGNNTAQLNATLAAGAAPDVFGYGGGNEATMVANGFLEELDGYFSEEQKAEWLHYAGALTNGGHYVIPFSGGASYRVIFMNKTLCEELNLEIPEYEDFTWDTLLTYGKEAVAAGKKGYVAPWIGDANAPMCNYINFLYQAGGSILDENGDYALNSPESIAAMKFIYDMFNTDKIVDSVNYTYDNAVATFNEGESLFLGAGVWSTAALSDTFEIEAYHMQGERYGCANAIDYISMNSASEHKDAAAALMSFLMKTENWSKKNDVLHKGSGVILSTVDTSAALDPRVAHLASECDNFWTFPAKEGISEACELMITHPQLVAMGDETPEEACQAMQDAIEAILAD